MQSKWLAKSATAIVLVALMATETVNPVPAYAGVPGVFATEYTQIPQLPAIDWFARKAGVDG